MKKDKKDKKEKKQKKPVEYAVKKLPKLFKKVYTQKKLDKVILKKIYIPSDKEYLQSLFEESGKNKKGKTLLSIPADKKFQKEEYNRICKLGKEISKQKGRFKLAPFIAVVVFISAIVLFSLFFKNKVIKSVIVNTVQKNTEARCDLDYINLSLVNATFELRGLEIADKSNPMKNIVSVGNVTFDFDMLELLKSKYIANDLSITDFNLNSDRTYSGELPKAELEKIQNAKLKKEQKAKEKEEKKKQKEKEKSENKKESKFAADIKNMAGNSVDTVKSSLADSFAPYNPQTMYDDLVASLQTPATTTKVQTEVQDLISRYSSYPQEIEADIAKGQNIVTTVQSINIEELKANPLKVKTTLEDLKKAYDDALAIKADTEAKINSLQKDYDKSLSLTKDIQKALENDTSIVKNKVSELTSLTMDDGVQFISETCNTVLCQLLGKYYPYYEKGMELLERVKKNKSEKPKKEKKGPAKRYKGRTIYYKADNTPKFWIKNIAGSGAGVSFAIKNVANDMDKTGVPASGELGLTLAGIKHNLDVLVDTRTTPDKQLVTAVYNSANLPVRYPSSNFGDVPGVPGIDSSVAALNLGINVKDQNSFGIDGIVDLTDVKLSAAAFEPSSISSVYAKVLAGITQFSSEFNFAYTEENGVKLGLETDADTYFAQALKAALMEELNAVKNQLEVELINKLNEYTNGALGDLNSFAELKDKIMDKQSIVDSLTSEIEGKMNQIQNLAGEKIDEAKAAAQKAAEEAAKKAAEEAERIKKEAEAEAQRKLKEAEEEAKKRLEEEAKKKLKSLF